MSFIIKFFETIQTQYNIYKSSIFNFQAEEVTADNFTSDMENELRQRNVDYQTEFQEEQPEFRETTEIVITRSKNELFWSVSIIFLVSAIILLILRRLFFM